VLTVVKVGGGLGREAGDDALRALCNTLGELGERHPLLVVPGGAGFADAVRDADRRFALRAATSHRMAILGMEQFGWLLSELIPRAARYAALARARELAAGRTAVLLPAGLPLDALPASWQVTSDSIAAWVAGQVGAGRLVLVKEIDGLFADWPSAPTRPPLARLSIAEFAALRAAGRAGGVDAYLPAVLEGAHFETWVIGGRDPERVAELLERGTTVGTRIGPARLLPWRHG
jgi:5-(aminomethyl)-3-furanmethanol phosphate kinase